MAPKRKRGTAATKSWAKKRRKAVNAAKKPEKTPMPAHAHTVATNNTSHKTRKTNTPQASQNKSNGSRTVGKTKKSRKVDNEVKDTDPKKTPGFFRLPAELRNRIYEDVLLPEGRRFLGRTVREPGLILTCRQIRDEARPLWYLRNRFSIRVEDCDASRLVKFVARIDSISVDAECDLLVDVKGNFDRQNLIEWCRAVHEDKGVEPVGSRGLGNGHQRMVFSILNVAKSSRGRSWEECLEAVERTMSQMAGNWR